MLCISVFYRCTIYLSYESRRRSGKTVALLADSDLALKLSYYDAIPIYTSDSLIDVYILAT